ncbi:MAG: PKD domain-containing protein [Flavobacteriales bacterium]|nr:PKD domain-containing protein [Flavobacteriales bacterium]
MRGFGLVLSLCAIVSITGVNANGQYEETILEGFAAHEKVHGSVKLRYKSYSNVPNFVEFGSLQLTQKDFSKWVSQFYEDPNAFETKYITANRDKLGQTHVRVQQYYRGIPIEYAQYNLHLQNGYLKSVNGELLSEIPVSNQPVLSEKGALQKALSFLNADLYMWQVPNEEKFIKLDKGDSYATYFPKGELVYAAPYGKFSESVHLAYKFDIYSKKPLARKYVYVDAHTGEIIMDVDRIHTADTPGTANTQYSGNRGIIADSFSGGFRLRESGRGNGIETYNMLAQDDYLNAVDFVDNDNIWNNVNAQQDEYATDVHWGTEMTYDYLLNVHGRNSIDNAGFKIKSYVHFKPLGSSGGYLNAFWDGDKMTYGDGDASANPVVSIDVEGHEISHGLIEFTAGLIYASESGALNESFADIFGTCVDFYARTTPVPNSGTPNWKIGEEIFINGTDYIRDMSDPNSKNDPDCYTGVYWMPTVGCTPSQGNDKCGVHTNSGVQNFWFYLLSMGGTGTNDLGNSYIVNGLGINDAEQIAFRNLTVYLTPSSDYADARFYAIQSATDLFGACSPEVGATTDAWYAVGVGAAYSAGVFADFAADVTQSCSAPLTVSFTNLTFNAVTNDWDFGDGNTSTSQDPVHTYSNYGTYTVELIVDGGVCGADTMVKVAYITIDSLLPCNIIMIPNDTFQTQTKCVGNLFDDGGANGTYSPAQDSYITIDPPGATSVTLTFNQFDIESGSGNNVNDPCDYDYIQIFDGDDIGDPLIGKYCNTTGSPGAVSSTGGPITVHFHSDPGLELAGFDISWTCSTAPVPSANADFTAPITTVCEGGTVNFSNLSTSASSFVWSFPGGVPSSSTAYNPVVSYPTAGTYDVTLTATNASGNDVETKVGFITVDATIPCEYIILPNNSATQTSCDGTVYDDGGPNGDYTEGHDSYLTISPTGAAQVELSFSSFGVEPGSGNFPLQPCDFDFIELFDGTSTNDPSLGRFCDANPPTIGTPITSSGNSVTIHFHSDPATVDLGFELDWNCLNPQNALPTAAFTTASTSICAGQPITFVNNSVNATGYNWTFPGGTPNSSTQASPTVTYSTPGTYSVTLDVTNPSGADTEFKQSYIVVSPGPTAAFSYSQTGNFAISFNDLSTSATNILWDFGDGSSSTQPNPIHTYDSAGTYLVCQYASDPTSGCPAHQSCFSVTVDTSSGTGYYPVSVAGIASPYVCTGNTVSYFDQSSNNPISWEWIFQGGNPATSNAQYPNVTYNAPGIYDVTLIVDNGIGKDTAYYKDSVVVLDAPLAAFTSTANILTANFTDLSVNTTNWAWDFGDGNGSNVQNPNHVYASGGVYNVCLTASNLACPADISCDQIAVVNGGGPQPSANFTQSVDTICEGETITFSDISSGGVLGWQWFFELGTPDTSYLQNPTVTYNTSGFHDVTLVVNNINGYDTLVLQNAVFIKGAPDATWNYYNSGLDVQFFNYSNHNDSWFWGFGEGGSDTTMNPFYSYPSPGSYFVCLTAENSLCPLDIQCDTITINAMGATSIVEGMGAIEPKFKIYPNPANESFFLEASTAFDQVNVNIYDVTGRNVRTISISGAAHQPVPISIDDFAFGSYLIRIGQNTYQLIKN